MRIVIPGGSGQVGTILARSFTSHGHDVVVLSRQPMSAPWRTVAWDARSPGAWTAELHDADAVINLAGRRWPGERRRAESIAQRRVHARPA